MIYEDGSGVADANSYATLPEAQDYHQARGNDAWGEASPAQQSAALIRATDYIETTYRAVGDPVSLSQGLQWPKLGDWGVPGAIKRATYLLALEALSGPLQGRVERGIRSKTDAMEGLGSNSVTYDDAPDDAFPHVTAMLAGIASLRSASSVWVGRVRK